MNLVITNVVTGNQGAGLIELRSMVRESLLPHGIDEKDTNLFDEIDSKIKQKITELSK